MRIGMTAVTLALSASMYLMFGGGGADAQPKASPASSQGRELSRVELKKLQESLKATTPHLAVQFKQRKFTALRKRWRESQGRAFFSQPDKFRWAIQSPIQDEWIHDGIAIFHYVPGMSSATRYRARGGKARELKEIVELVMDFNSLLKRYTIQSAKRFGEKVKILLHPRKKKGLKEIELEVISTSRFVSKIELRLTNNNILQIEFSKPARGAIANSRYQLPKGVRVTDAT